MKLNIATTCLILILSTSTAIAAPSRREYYARSKQVGEILYGRGEDHDYSKGDKGHGDYSSKKGVDKKHDEDKDDEDYECYCIEKDEKDDYYSSKKGEDKKHDKDKDDDDYECYCYEKDDKGKGHDEKHDKGYGHDGKHDKILKKRGEDYKKGHEEYGHDSKGYKDDKKDED
ncbi:18223_t:CDS:2, partial [Racocetra persica]